MDNQLAQLVAVSNQRDKTNGFLSLLSTALVQTDLSAVVRDAQVIVKSAVNDDHVGLVVARQVVGELVRHLTDGVVRDVIARKKIIENTLDIVRPRFVSFEEQVRGDPAITENPYNQRQ